jgi:GH25 family lysozyme M1 (1,4-beta-N-acetylmuramidase)
MNFANHNVIGPDVSFYQDAPTTPEQINFGKMAGAGAHFVIIKAGQRDYPDPDFVHNWREAKAAGIPRGSYWFYDSRADPKAQAQKWWSLIQDDPGELMHFLDLEENYNGTWKDWTYWYDCLYEFQRVSGLPNAKIGVYTGFYWWIEHAPMNVLSLAWFARFPLWLASYTSQTVARVPEPWTECLFWQYGTPPVGYTYGVESVELDMNAYNGTPEAFRAYFGLTEVLPPPDEPEEGTTMQGTVRQGCALKVRDATGADTGKRITAGDVVYGAVTAGRIYFPRVYRLGVTVEETPGNAATVDPANPATSYMILADVAEPVTPPVVEPPAAITLTHTIEVYSDGSIRVDAKPV